jgi:hypothetical protein
MNAGKAVSGVLSGLTSHSTRDRILRTAADYGGTVRSTTLRSSVVRSGAAAGATLVALSAASAVTSAVRRRSERS